MSQRIGILFALFTLALLMALPAAVADDALDKALEALKTYDWGKDRAVLKPIEDAVVASQGDTAEQRALEMRLAAALKSDVPRASKDFLCRQLSLVGSAGCVPVLAELLPDEKLSHMARYALERIPHPDAVKALRDAIPKLKGELLVGVINSLGVRRDAQSVDALTGLLGDSDHQVAAAAAAALGNIGTPEAARALDGFRAKAPKSLALAAADASLVCAERLLAAGHKVEAMGIYQALARPDQPKHVRLAATRGMLSAAGKK